MGTIVMCASAALLLLCRHRLGRLFTSEADVIALTAQAVPPLAVSLIGARTRLWGALRHGGSVSAAALAALCCKRWCAFVPCVSACMPACVRVCARA